MAYERLHGPLGGQRDDFLAATISNTIAATFSKTPPPLSEFMPDWPELMRGGDDGDHP